VKNLTRNFGPHPDLITTRGRLACLQTTAARDVASRSSDLDGGHGVTAHGHRSPPTRIIGQRPAHKPSPRGTAQDLDWEDPEVRAAIIRGRAPGTESSCTGLRAGTMPIPSRTRVFQPPRSPLGRSPRGTCRCVAGRGSRHQWPLLPRPATRLITVANTTAPSRYDSKACRSAVTRIGRVCRSVSDT
jgi:hypothetical protein